MIKSALTAFLAGASLLSVPAHAVDYVKCEAMSKMYVRLSLSMRSALEDGEAKRFSDLSKKAAAVRMDYNEAGCAL